MAPGGTFDTHGLGALSTPLAAPSAVRLAAVAAALADVALNRCTAKVLGRFPAGWRNVPSTGQAKSYLAVDGTEHHVEYRFTRGGVVLPGDDGVRVVTSTPHEVVLADAAGAEIAHAVHRYDDTVCVDSPSGSVQFRVVRRLAEPGSAVASGSLVAPMPGLVIRIGAESGAVVHAGQPLVWLEAMKMEHTLTAPNDGVLEELNVVVGQQVDVGAVLARIESPEGDQ